MKAPQLQYEFNPDGPNKIIDDGEGGTYLAIREVRWGPDKQYKLDIRRYLMKDEEEKPLKGVSFSNKDTADQVAESLVDIGYGKTSILLEALQKRDDYATCQDTCRPATEMLDEVFNNADTADKSEG